MVDEKEKSQASGAELVHLPDRVFNPDYERATLPANLYVPAKY